MTPYFSHDDIAQIATPPGSSLIGAVRISGPGAFAILAACCDGLEDALGGRPSRGVHDCRLRLELTVHRGEKGRVRETHRCPARAFLMPGPASYTREDVAELHLPGSPALLRAALEVVTRAGARPAAAGEFTFRAFRNGRLRLAQAEAVEEVIRAEGDAERRAALARLGDASAGRVRAWRDRLLGAAARLEALLDFPDDVPDADLAGELAEVAAELEREGLAIAHRAAPPEGGLPRAALAGRVNAGKSSLFNAILGYDAALASPEASTTHDILRRETEWRGRRYTLSDRPGFHPGGDGRAREAAERAAGGLGGEDVLVWVVDGSRHYEEADIEPLRAAAGRRTVVAVNKCDLPAALLPGEAAELARRAGLDAVAALRVSAITGEGVDALREILARETRRSAAADGWNRRERLELARALGHCRAAWRELSGPGRLELAADDARRAVESMSLAMGEGYSEEALARIFSGFCIGK